MIKSPHTATEKKQTVKQTKRNATSTPPNEEHNNTQTTAHNTQLNKQHKEIILTVLCAAYLYSSTEERIATNDKVRGSNPFKDTQKPTVNKK